MEGRRKDSVLKRFLFTRMLQSLASLIGLICLVFFLVRMTGNPADLYLPENATQEVREEFAIRHGLNDPILVQFGRFAMQLACLDLGDSMRQAGRQSILSSRPTRRP